MSVQLVVVGTRKMGTDEEFQAYSKGVGPLFKAAGAVPSTVYRNMGNLTGESPQTISVVDFPSEEALRSVMESDAYAEIAVHRDASFDRLEIFVADSVTPPVG